MNNQPPGGNLNLAQLLRIPFQALVTELHARLAAAGYPDVRPPHSAVFAHLGMEGMRLTELADRTQLTKQMLGYLVDALAAGGYVERVPDPTDGRAKLVRLTARGVAAAHVGSTIIQNIEHDWATRLGTSEMETLRAILERLLPVLTEHDDGTLPEPRGSGPDRRISQDRTRAVRD